MRIDPVRALAAADVVGGGRAMTFRSNGVTCYRVAVAPTFEHSRSFLLDAVQDWARDDRARPIDAVGDLVGFTVCDPGRERAGAEPQPLRERGRGAELSHRLTVAAAKSFDSGDLARCAARVFVGLPGAEKLVLAVRNGTPTAAQAAQLRELGCCERSSMPGRPRTRSRPSARAVMRHTSCPDSRRVQNRRGIVVIVAAVVLLSACTSGAEQTTGLDHDVAGGELDHGRAPLGDRVAPRPSPPQRPRCRSRPLPGSSPSRVPREVVLADTHALLVIGGLDPGGASTARVWHVALPGGITTRLAVLPQPMHDSAGAVLGSATFVFGGGSARELATVQRYRAGVVSVVGQMPQARSDLVAVAVAGTAYVLGGFDGTSSIASVLATTDGSTFRTVAQLPQTRAISRGRGARWPDMALRR